MSKQTTKTTARTAAIASNPAKFAFFYLLSLVALIFMAVSTGIIIFQIINKNIPDVSGFFPGAYDSGALKFAISAIIIATPIYYVLMTLINRSLTSGDLKRDAGERRWLTYFILFVSAVVMIGWLIATIYNFLDGELTTKFILKALTAIIIAAAIFTFYFYDIRRERVKEGDRVINYFFYISLAVVLITLVSAFFFVESPKETRARKEDSLILDKFSMIDNAVNSYYFDNKMLPADLNELVVNSGIYYISENDLKNPVTNEAFVYNIAGTDTYNLCATFKTSNKDSRENFRYYAYADVWPHDAGYQCLSRKIRQDVKGIPRTDIPSVPMPAPIQ